jgi:transcriptional regulator with XRE-family HTH domain
MLREARVARGLTQQQVADMAFLSVQVISRMENGKSISRSSFLRVCQVIGINPEDIRDIQITKRPGPKTA